MKTAIVYLHVVGKSDSTAPPPEHYAPWTERFLEYYHKAHIPPGMADLVIVLCGGELEAAGDKFPEAAEFIEYHGAGWDIGAHQHAMHVLDRRYDFAINCATPVYFKDRSFVQRMVDARLTFGDGLYGPTASLEASPHIRTCCWAADIQTFKQYPWVVDCRAATFMAEAGAQSITRWYIEQGKPTIMVAGSGNYGKGDWRKPTLRNIFRRGDQSNILVGDRHSDIFDKASEKDRGLLSAIADGLVDAKEALNA